MKVLEPNDFFNRVKEKLAPNIVIAFVSAIIFGLITHMYYITNNFPNADTNLCAGMYLNGYDWMLSIGRWLAYFFDAISSYFILPWIDGIIALVLLGIIASLIVSMFDIKNKVNVIIIAGSIVTFPSIMANFGYVNYADTFMYSYLFAVLSIYIANKVTKLSGKIISVILIACSVGIYQSFICVSIVLCILIILKDILDNQIKLRQLMYKIFSFFCVGGLGMILYFIMWKVAMLIRHVEPANYKGLTDYGNYSLSSILRNMIDGYRFSIKYLYTNELFYNPSYKIVSYVILSLIGALLLVSVIKRKKIYLESWKLVLLVIDILIIPLGFGFIKIIAPATTVSPLTMEQISLFILTIIIILESVDFKNTKIGLLNWLVLFGSVLIIHSNILISNVGYVNLQLQYEKSYSSMQRIVDRIIGSEYYSKDIPIFIAGDIMGDNYYTATPQQKEYLKGLELVASDVSVYNTMFAKESFIRTYFGIYIQYTTDEIQQKILNSDDFKQMPIFPDKECTKVIDGVLVVKMCQ